jgi:hypothetical protein
MGFASRPKVCTAPAMRLQTTVALSPIRGLVTRIDRCSSGASQCRESGRRSTAATCYYVWGSPTLTSLPAWDEAKALQGPVHDDALRIVMRSADKENKMAA